MLIHRAARAALDHVLFHRDQQIVGRGKLLRQFAVKRFHETHVRHCCTQLLACFQGYLHAAAEGQQRDLFALQAHLALAQRQRRHLFLDRRAGTTAPGVTHRRRLVQ